MNLATIKAIIIIAVIVGVLAYTHKAGYESAETKYKLLIAEEKERTEQEIERIRGDWNAVSAEYQNIISKLEVQKTQVITKIVEKEIETNRGDYDCKLPTSGLRAHESIIESLRATRAAGGPSNPVSRAEPASAPQ